MRVKKLVQLLLKKSAMFVLVYAMSFSHVYSNNDNEVSSNEEEWYGEREGQNRSTISPTFTIYLNNGILSIQNANPIYDLNITIINNVTGEEVYHTYISKEVSNYFTLPVSTLGSGEYCLTISNPVAGYVLAYFRL